MIVVLVFVVVRWWWQAILGFAKGFLVRSLIVPVRLKSAVLYYGREQAIQYVQHSL